MSDEEQAPQKAEAGGVPAWVMTFADLMSLLMCFFVLLLSFSEMDVQKYKQIAGSMKNAFGVQRDIRAHEIPKGTSIVKKEFSPGKPQPTLIKQVRQKTTDDNHKKLEVKGNSKIHAQKQTKDDASRIAKLLEQEIRAGKVEVETKNQKIIIRILERGAFSSGFDEINPVIKPLFKKIRKILKHVDGRVRIAGHTDDISITNNKFRSNWSLSVARAAAIAHAIISEDDFDESRLEIIGFAHTKPLVPNTSKANRTKNRRIEISIIQNDKDRVIKKSTDIDTDITKAALENAPMIFKSRIKIAPNPNSLNLFTQLKPTVLVPLRP